MLTVVALLVLGVVAGQLRWLPDGAGAVLDAVVIRLALPGLILVAVPELRLGPEVLVPVAVAWGTLVLSAGAVWAWARAAALSRATTGTLLLVIPLANTSFLGFPAVEALLGADHLPPAVLYDQLGTFLALATYGSIVASRYGSGPAPSPGLVARRVLVFPPFVALAVGLLLVPVGLPDVVRAVAAPLGATVTPLAMLAVGLRLRLDGTGWRFGVLAGGLGLRLVVVPALVLVVAVLVGGEGIAWRTSILQSAMPPMVTAGVLASQAGLDARLAARLVGIGALLSMLTLPAWATLLT